MCVALYIYIYTLYRGLTVSMGGIEFVKQKIINIQSWRKPPKVPKVFACLHVLDKVSKVATELDTDIDVLAKLIPFAKSLEIKPC